MILGAVVVIVVGILIFNYFKNINKGEISQSAVEETTKQQEVEIVEKDGLKFAKGLPTTYKVQKGDHLWKIAEQYYTSGYNWVDIAKANNLKDANAIVVDQELIIPNVELKVATLEKQAIETKQANTIDTDTYTTIKGDHLWDIAVRAYGDGYAWTKIYNANKAKIGNNPNRLFTGVQLALPR